MAELKTKPNDQDVQEFLESVEDEKKRIDSNTILELMKDDTGAQPKMWGNSIIGFVNYKYKYASGREGEWFLTGFSPRKKNLTLYIMSGFEGSEEILDDLGKFTTGKSCLYIKKIEDVAELAPLHNPPNLKGIYAVKHLLPNIPQVAVFDTAFHQTMPDYAYMYAIPYSLYKKYGLRRYGFHGTSHKYVSHKACEMLNMDIKKQRIITCHLGNGASITAIKHGKSVDTSMGLTPVEGMIMGTRSGDLDLGVLTFIMNKEEIRVQEANTLINKHSGMLGISGVSSDMREVQKAANEGHKRSELALKMYSYRIKKYLGAYCAAMDGMDIVVFTGGIGENDITTRYEACKNMEFLGIDIDKGENDKIVHGKQGVISKEGSKVKVVVIPTNEELVIAQETVRILNHGKKGT